ncbi:MAG: TatD family hydrolase [Spirochaetaceae bacterium]|jgi:TatD DNase family protein|nr:TatD family hydrolase [Spirochaetaceae bacterium]
MFSDTPFHLKHLRDRGVDVGPELAALAERDTFFALDIGTESNDMNPRSDAARTAIESIQDPQTKTKIEAMLHFSLGIWPGKEAILRRAEAVAELRANLDAARRDPFLAPRIAAIGECGLDHHWNPAGVDKRSQDDFDARVFAGEAELFEALLSLGLDTDLPVIVHSREAFDGTMSCMAHSGVTRGVMHCFSYGIPEARAVLNQGWYISFSGSITYARKSALEESRELLRFVPRDRLLIETDAPYLAPGPHRGKTNTPVWVEEVYRCAAERLDMRAEDLSRLVDGNIRALFRL